MKEKAAADPNNKHKHDSDHWKSVKIGLILLKKSESMHQHMEDSHQSSSFISPADKEQNTR